ncbi:testis-specific serine/threonine-protein kinase 1-like isoform X1 [Ostrea edulis]|uniref:testis-specific serine/threonine-protein kinase 1-like isoform X1 n=1 Tax=Ostrea edulis TaxID=37623 RepID=UPI0024AFBFB3|nr:testis-specific serine/threonine-protein kinase 1-like isoform X1 [Ostrea edulis]
MNRGETLTPREFLRLAEFFLSFGYRLGSTIGEGTYSKVRAAERTSNGETLAVKMIDKRNARKDYVEKFLPRELEIATLVKHPNVICTYEVLHHGDCVYLMMDYAAKGDLLQLIQTCGYLSEEDAKRMFREMVEALKYLHNLGVTHRDLKCENILIMSDKRVAISDFGFSRLYLDVQHSDVIKCKTYCGSRAYASPELLSGSPYDPRTNDVWSLGVVLFVMNCGTMPFDDRNLNAMLKKQISEGISIPDKVKERISSLCVEIINKILDPNTKSRLGVLDILSSQWFKS